MHRQQEKAAKAHPSEAIRHMKPYKKRKKCSSRMFLSEKKPCF